MCTLYCSYSVICTLSSFLSQSFLQRLLCLYSMVCRKIAPVRPIAKTLTVSSSSSSSFSSSSSSYASSCEYPATSVAFSIFWRDVCRMWPFLFLFFFNPTIEVVTFRLRGFCMLDAFLLPAFARQGHECQDLMSPLDGMPVCTDYTSVYALIRALREWNHNQC